MTTAARQLPANVQISLVNTGFNVPGLNPGHARADRQGAFRHSRTCRPDSTRLIARATINAGREGGPAGRGMPRRRAAASRLPVAAVAAGPPCRPIRRGCGAATDVTVDGRNVSNVVLTLQPGVPVVGPHRVRRNRAAARGSLAPARDAAADRDVPALRRRVSTAARRDVSTPTAASRSPASCPAATGLTRVGRRHRVGFSGRRSIDGQDSLDFPVEIKARRRSAARS